MTIRPSRYGRAPVARLRVIPVALGIAAALGAVALAGWPHLGSRPTGAGSPPGSPGLQVGQPAPAVVVPGLGGGPLALALYAGHPRVLTFFATACGECLGDLAVLEPVYRKHRARGLVVLGIGVEDTAPNLSRAARRLGVSFPLGYDEDGDRVVRPYGLYSIPTTVFIDGDGIVRAVVQGSVRGSTLERDLALILPGAAR